MRVFRERLSTFTFDFEGGMWDLIVLIPDQCLCIIFKFQRQSVVEKICIQKTVMLAGQSIGFSMIIMKIVSGR